MENIKFLTQISRKQDRRLRTLPELYLECRMSQMDGVLDPSIGHWNYFMQYLNLLADVCVDRNPSPLNSCYKIYPSELSNSSYNRKL